LKSWRVESLKGWRVEELRVVGAVERRSARAKGVVVP
jgi:hypothetical protein